MSDLGELDRPGTPGSPGAWDARSEEWPAGESDVPGGGDADGGGFGGLRPRKGLGAGGGSEALTGGAALGGGSEAFTGGSGVGSEVTAGSEVTVGEPAFGADGGEAVTGSKSASDSARCDPGRFDPGPERTPPPARRAATADPVKALMHRHRELCARAVDPLEIAVGLEAHGVTDRTAARFRHRDVFSLAEEMYARVPRDGGTPQRPTAPAGPRARADWALLALLPGALCAATLVGLRVTHGQPRLITAAVGVLAVAVGTRAALSRGPLGTTDRTCKPGSGTWTCWLLAYVLLGDGLLRAAVGGGPDGLPTGAADGPWPLAAAPALALAPACVPAVWSAHFFAVRARRRLTASRGLAEFAASVQPLLFGTFALFLCALTALVALSGAALDEPAAFAQATTLGALLFLARLLTAYGFTHAPAMVLTATATAEGAALATVFASRLPGCGFLAAPVETLVRSWGPGSVPTLACGAAALTLLLHATRTLTRASAHARSDGSS